MLSICQPQPVVSIYKGMCSPNDEQLAVSANLTFPPSLFSLKCKHTVHLIYYVCQLVKMFSTANGYCQAPPPGCPIEVYAVMVDCW